MLVRLRHLSIIVACATLFVGVFAPASVATRPPRVSGLTVHQFSPDRLQVAWRPVFGARYQMRVAPRAALLRKAPVVAARSYRGTATPKLRRPGAYVVQVRAIRGGAKGRWSRPHRVRLLSWSTPRSGAGVGSGATGGLTKPPTIPVPPVIPTHSPKPVPKPGPGPGPGPTPTPTGDPTSTPTDPTPPGDPSSPGDSEPALGPVSFSSVAAMKASGMFHIPSDANLVTWHFGDQTLEQVFMQLKANDILVLPERSTPYYIDSSDGFRAAGVSAVTGQDGKLIPIVNTYQGKPARTWFAMARATRGVIGLGPGAVIEPTDSGFRQEAQIPDKGSALPGGGTSPGRWWYNTAGVKQKELVGSQEKMLETVTPDAYFGNFTMRGRDFGGVAYSALGMKGGTAERLDLDGAWRGFEAVPNGETGAIVVSKGTYFISRVSMSPLDENGKRVGSSPVMINNSPGGRWEYADVRQARAGMPTIWHSSGTHVWYDVASRWGTKQAVNLEDVVDGFSFQMIGGALWANRGGKGGHPSPDGIYGNGMHIAMKAEGRATITLKDVDLDNNVQPGKLCVQLYGGTDASKVRIVDDSSGRPVPVAAYGSGGTVQTAQ